MNIIYAAQGNDLTISQELASMSTSELREELGRSLQLNAQQLTRLAGIWAELERRGEDLSALKAGMGQYIPMIAAGRLDANAVVRFAGQATLLRALSEIPIEQQRDIVGGSNVEVATIGNDGEIKTLSLPLYALTASQVRQVFAPGRIRDKSEQAAVIMKNQVLRNRGKTKAASTGKARYDAATDEIVIGRSRVPVSEIFSLLASASEQNDSETPEAESKILALYMTPNEHKRIRIKSAESGAAMASIAKVALRRAGLI